MPWTIEDREREAEEEEDKIVKQFKSYDDELVSLNEEYGDNVVLLKKKQSVECLRCGYREEFEPHKKILKREYSIEPNTRVYFDGDGFPSFYTIFDLVFLIDCECSKINKVHIPITLRNALQALQERKKLVQTGERPDSERFYM